MLFLRGIRTFLLYEIFPIQSDMCSSLVRRIYCSNTTAQIPPSEKNPLLLP